MNLNSGLLTAFLIVLSTHLGMSMELAFVIWGGAFLSVLAGLKLVVVERPTWGLVVVMMAGGGFVGSQLLEDIASEGSWIENYALFAGLLISLLLYLIWRFAARDRNDANRVFSRDAQTILIWGVVLLLLMPPPESSVISVLDLPLASLTFAGLVLAILVPLASRSAGSFVRRVLLMLPVFLFLPVAFFLLGNAQGPVLATVANILPSSGGASRVGFSPYQSLNPNAFLRPSTRPVMRLQSEALTTRYLAGNRMVRLGEDLSWQPSDQGRRFLGAVDSVVTDAGEVRFPIENNHAAVAGSSSITIHGLNNDNFIFVSPGTQSITGRFATLSKSSADIWIPDFEGNADRRWQLEVGGEAAPAPRLEANLELPLFWDEPLQSKSEGFAASDARTTVNNVVQHFKGRPYSLRTNFNPEKPFHDFYLNEEAAYCFWFATGTALALRANGIPTRLVSGFAINEQLSSELWLVRDRDAHSWVEWQDEAGYWHTVDPTPASMLGFFGGYESSAFSVWYHYLAGQWQILLDKILEDELTTDLVRYSGLLILLFLFVREYRRIRVEHARSDSLSRRWEKLWQRFIAGASLPNNEAWTAQAYMENIPSNWPEKRQVAARNFLASYSTNRFSNRAQDSIDAVEDSLQHCLREFANNKK